VYPIGRLFVPTLRSFGPLPRDSSEGFLVSLTPGFSERVAEKSFFAILSSLRVSHERVRKARKLQQGRETESNMATRPHRKPGFPPWSGRDDSDRYIPPSHSPDGKPVYFSSTRETPEEEIRIDLMTPAPRFVCTLGILGSSNPTDEALRKGRNTKRWWTNSQAVRYTCLCPYIKSVIKTLKENTGYSRQTSKFTLTNSFGKQQLVTTGYREVFRNNLNAI